MRGGLGEVQLAMLLENILAPDQYEANVKTKAGSDATVEFAIKLPGKDDINSTVWIPVDAKFPKDVYEHLQNAYEDGSAVHVEQAQKELENTIKKMAKDIRDKYLDPPKTTDFGILFLPFEGIYAEVVRKAALLETLQRDYKIIVTGPTTLAAIINSLQMGFKTLAIQKRSGEVWNVLGEVKKEFNNFGGMMQKAQKNIQTGLNQLDDVMGVRTRAIERKLKDVSTLMKKTSPTHYLNLLLMRTCSIKHLTMKKILFLFVFFSLMLVHAQDQKKLDELASAFTEAFFPLLKDLLSIPNDAFYPDWIEKKYPMVRRPF